MSPEKKLASWRLWVAAVLAALLLIVALQNSQNVDVEILMISMTAPLIVIILASAAIGAVVGYVAPLVRKHHRDGRGCA